MQIEAIQGHTIPEDFDRAITPLSESKIDILALRYKFVNFNISQLTRCLFSANSKTVNLRKSVSTCGQIEAIEGHTIPEDFDPAMFRWTRTHEVLQGYLAYKKLPPPLGSP